MLEAIRNYYEHDNANVHRGIHELSNRATAAYEGARDRVAQFINAPAREDIIFTRGTTESLNLVAATWGAANLREDDIILLTELEHHSNLVPWQLLAQRTGAQLRFIPVTGDERLRSTSANLDTLLDGCETDFAHAHFQCARHHQSRCRNLRQSERSWSVTLVDAAPIRRSSCRWTCKPSAAISSLSPATNSVGPPASARFVRPARIAGSHAAVPRRRRNDFQGRVF